jgi:hypothetical protein
MSELATKQPGRDRVQLCMNLLLLNGALRLRWAIPPLLPPLLLLALLRAPGAAAPLSPLCSMAGSHDGARCACLEGWRGDRCSVLDLAPAVSADAIRA